MKKVLMILSVALIAVAFAACAPKLRVLSDMDYTAANGITQASLAVDDATFDLLGMRVNQYTDYDKVEKGDEHIATMKMNNVEVSKMTNHSELKAMKKYLCILAITGANQPAIVQEK